MENSLVHPKEATYFWICAVLSALIYLLLVISIFGIIYIALGVFLAFLAHGSLIGALKGNAVRVGPRQFPQLHATVEAIAAKADMPQVPQVFVNQSGGVLNAFATRFVGRNFMVINSDVLELASLNGQGALDFIVGHEMGHLKLGHLKKMPWLYPALMMPFLGTAYYRACEYSADRCGKAFAPQGSPSGLLVLAAGKHLHGEMSADEFVVQANEENGFFVWITEKLSTHPNLAKRVRELMKD